MSQLKKASFYCLPKDLLLNSTLRKYSNGSKILIAILLSCANSSSEINEAAEIINQLGDDAIAALMDSTKNIKDEVLYVV